jgi:hypothetical protein
MKHSCSLKWLLVFFSVCVLFSRALGDISAGTETIESGVYCYKVEEGDEVNTVTWDISYKEIFTEIHVSDGKQKMVNICRRDGETLYWSSSKEDGTKVHINRVDNALRITKEISGEYSSNIQEIDKLPWFQPLSYSLQNFLISDNNVVHFWSVRNDTLDVVHLKAAKAGREMLVFGDVEVPTMKIEIRMAGIFAPFWHGTYWYRLTDLLFLQYRGAQGPPGSARMLIRFMETCE